MPYEYARDDALKRVTVTTSGVLTLPEMLSVVERQASEGAWAYGVLYVPRDLTNYPRPEEMRTLVNRVRSLTSTLGPRGPIAIVDPRPAGFGMWRMYGTLAEEIGLTVHIFRDVQGAERWLAEQQPTLGT